MSITKLAIACSVALGAMTLSLAPLSQAADTKAPPVKAKAKAKAKAPAKAAAKAEPEEDADVGDLSASTTTEFNCELGNKITIYSNASDDNYIALRWKKRLHRLKRVGTTTGAQRFENPLYGLIWIGIPAKGMLLDSKMNRQLANECKDAEQAKPPVTQEAPAGAASPSAQAPSAEQKGLL
ncbi:hypothetical protein [Janthinobacterium agaricidamnosum]|uniref:Exported signal peptide protein n=1 Tax=Janthinobacterium agaricidamnosum NBRC 102515 = DSM 9628 TaxID=1349767 RepID=W0V5L5_9BURK|nr:hypothetical protein [Janthinobacterium agaricidamnosum]CDG84119.1 putative uncharacterized protein [Janthinobacterium agaricidamnosum NBRC 102515 = DSM 9628]